MKKILLLTALACLTNVYYKVAAQTTVTNTWFGINLSRADGNNHDALVFQTGTTDRWFLGMGAWAGDHFFINNNATGAHALFINATSSNVGIGTTSPLYKLHVAGDIGIDQPYAFRFANGQTIADDNYGGLNINSNYGISNNVHNGRYFTINGGNVGIGTTSPAELLTVNGNFRTTATNDNNGMFVYDAPTGGNHIFSLTRQSNDLAIGSYANIGFSPGATSGASTNYAMFIKANGNVGIGTTNPQSPLHVLQHSQDATGLIIQGSTVNTDLANHYVALSLDGDYGNGTGNYSQIRSYSNLYYKWGSELAFFTTQSNVANTLNERMRIDANGNVAIGTTDPKGYKLAVAGNMIAEQVNVKLQANWPDYVFKKAYNLWSLSDLKTYIDQNHHLPEIPAAAEVEKNGLNLGEMNKILVKKVEELTLYLIEKDKEIEAQKKINEGQNARLKLIEQQLGIK